MIHQYTTQIIQFSWGSSCSVQIRLGHLATESLKVSQVQNIQSRLFLPAGSLSVAVRGRRIVRPGPRRRTYIPCAQDHRRWIHLVDATLDTLIVSNIRLLFIHNLYQGHCSGRLSLNIKVHPRPSESRSDSTVTTTSCTFSAVLSTVCRYPPNRPSNSGCSQ